MRLLGFLVLHELQTDEEPLASDVSQGAGSLGYLPQFAAKIGAHSLRILVEFLIFDDLEHLHSHQALDRTTSECVKMDLFDAVHNLLSGGHCCQRITVSDTLCHRHNIRLNTIFLESPEILADSAEASLNLVAYAQTTVLAG